MPTIAGTSRRLQRESEGHLYLQAHRENDRFFAASGVHLVQTNCGQFLFPHAPFSSHLKSRVGNILAKSAALRIIYLKVFQFPKQPNVCETCRLINFSFSSFIAPMKTKNYTSDRNVGDVTLTLVYKALSC
jgi:hypothetical protein